MKLATFTPENTFSNRTSIQLPRIGISKTSGTFRFNQALVEKLKLTTSLQLLWHQDQTEKGDWFLEIVKKDGFPLRFIEKQVPKGLVMQNSTLAKKIFDSVDCMEKSGHVTIGEPFQFEGKKLFPVITAMLKS